MAARIACLASGGGSNLQAILDHFATLGESRPGDVVLVASDRAGTGALARAAAHGIDGVTLDATARSVGLLPLLRARHIDLVVLAGYLRLIPADVTAAYRGRIVNIHPALLPAFGGPGMYGSRVHEAVLAQGARISGVTVHFVDEHYDRGPIIAQWPVPVLDGDTAAHLAHRVLEVEHAVYPRVVQALAAGVIRLSDSGRAVVDHAGETFTHFARGESADDAARALDARLGTALPPAPAT